MIKTNYLLATLLIITLIISTTSILINLNKLEALETTSHATDQGTITLIISREISITTQDGSYIDFGACKILEEDFIINSERTQNTTTACPSFQITNISVRNDGDIPATLEIKSNQVGEAQNGTFLQSESKTSQISYKITNAGRLNNQGGCSQGLNYTTYTPFMQANQKYTICEKLEPAPTPGTNSIITNFEILIPKDVNPGTREVQIEFSGVEYVEPP